MSTRRSAAVFAFTFLFVAAAFCPCFAQQAPETPVKIAVFPFAMHAPNDLNYLQSGIRDMLNSRLAWQGKVQVIDRSQTEQAVRGTKDVSQGEAIKAGAALKADYVLFGSITATGQSVSIDAKMASVSGKTEPVAFYAQTKSLDDIIPQVNLFAQDINHKVFARPGDKSAAAESEAELAATRNPELLIPGAFMSGDKISYLNPNFIEITPEGSLRQPGLWKSQTFQGGIVSMDVGDLDGDGRMEMAAVTHNTITIYRREQQALRALATYQGSTVDHFLSVSVSDARHDGQAYIYVNNMRKLNTSKGTNDNAADNTTLRAEIQAMVFVFEGGKLKIVGDKIPYFVNMVQMGQRGRMLLGQQQGLPNEGPFKGEIYEMQMKGNTLEPIGSVGLPDRCNVFNFVKADINNDKMEEIILIDQRFRMFVLNPGGEQMWRGKELFGATTNTFEGKVTHRAYNDVDMFGIPASMVVTDLNKDGIPEIVVNRNVVGWDKLIPDSMKYYDKGEIVSLSWDQLGLVENWKTREVEGMITAIRVGDLTGGGVNQLIVSMVLAKDLLKLFDSKSTIFSYDLNVAPSKAVAAKE